MANADFIVIQYRAKELADAALLCYWTQDVHGESGFNHHRKNLREQVERFEREIADARKSGLLGPVMVEPEDDAIAAACDAAGNMEAGE